MKFRYLILPIENDGDPYGTNDRAVARKAARELEDMGMVIDALEGKVLGTGNKGSAPFDVQEWRGCARQ